MKNTRICLVGAHGTGKSTICTRVILTLMQNAVNKEIINPIFAINTFQELQQKINELYNIQLIPEQFREVVQLLGNSQEFKQTDEITLATYAKQLYLENIYTAQGKNILCDRSVLDTFIYCDYFNNIKIKSSIADNTARLFKFNESLNCYFESLLDFDVIKKTAYNYLKTYRKIYIIEPSEREIEPDGFRMTDKKQQLEVHKLFLEYFKNLDNVEIVNQEEAHREEFINKVISEFVL